MARKVCNGTKIHDRLTRGQNGSLGGGNRFVASSSLKLDGVDYNLHDAHFVISAMGMIPSFSSFFLPLFLFFLLLLLALIQCLIIVDIDR